MAELSEHDRSSHILALARDLLDDLELLRLSGESIVLRSARLARLVGDGLIQEWLGYELRGYPAPMTPGTLATRYLYLTGRVSQKGTVYWGPLAQQEADTATARTRLENLRVPDISYSVASANPYEHVTGSQLNPANSLVAPMNAVVSTSADLAYSIGYTSAIRSRVFGLLHTWVSAVYYERLFSAEATSIFDEYKAATDRALASRCEEALAKMADVYERLGAGHPEAVTHAITTCRRILDALADASYPPRESIHRGGKIIELSQLHTRNRMREYVRERVTESRFERLNHTIRDLYDRCGAGVHNEITFDEAKSLLLLVYVFVGEVLSLPDTRPTIDSSEAPGPSAEPQPENAGTKG